MALPRAPPSSRRPGPSQQQSDNEPLEYIGDFRRGKEIGKGSFATVYLAQHRVSNPHTHLDMKSSGGEAVAAMLTDTAEVEVLCCHQSCPCHQVD